ncbi:protein LDOC1-like [Aquarana catesbeiana]|uniref:protein LDOC1-like n=1 Tax=Aquarana catesbeiana TaxID=8400 RepID=UPI003CC9A120
MEELCRLLAGLTQAVKSLQLGYSRLEEQVQVLASPSNPQGASSAGFTPTPSVVILPPEPRVPTPKKFAGECSKYRDFRNACKLYFSLQPRTLSLEATKVGFVISLLTGEPQTWAHRLLEQKSGSLDNLDAFFSVMSQLYEDP